MSKVAQKCMDNYRPGTLTARDAVCVFIHSSSARQERRAQQERNAGCARTAFLWKIFVLIAIFGRPLPKATILWKGLARKAVPGWGRSIFTSPPQTFTGH